MAGFGRLLKGLGGLLVVVIGIWGLVLCLDIITDVTGFWGLVASLLLAPITFLVVPLYAGFAMDIWFPVVLNYGGTLLAVVLMWVGNVLDRDSGRSRA